MKTIDVVIPDEYVEEFARMVDTIPPIAVVDALHWTYDVCQSSRGKLPMPRYVTSKGIPLPAVYGYAYTAMIAIVGYKLAFSESGDK